MISVGSFDPVRRATIVFKSRALSCRNGGTRRRDASAPRMYSPIHASTARFKSAWHSLEMWEVVAIPLGRDFLPQARIGLKLADHIEPTFRFHVPIAVGDFRPLAVDFQRPLPFLVHPDETAPIPVAFLFE